MRLVGGWESKLACQYTVKRSLPNKQTMRVLSSTGAVWERAWETSLETGCELAGDELYERSEEGGEVPYGDAAVLGAGGQKLG